MFEKRVIFKGSQYKTHLIEMKTDTHIDNITISCNSQLKTEFFKIKNKFFYVNI